MPVKKKAAPKKKVIARKIIKVKPLGKTISKPKMPAKPKRVQTATGWRRMMLKAKKDKKS